MLYTHEGTPYTDLDEMIEDSGYENMPDQDVHEYFGINVIMYRMIKFIQEMEEAHGEKWEYDQLEIHEQQRWRHYCSIVL